MLHLSRAFIGIVGLVSVSFLAPFDQGTGSRDSRSLQASKWYVGGTLHRKSALEWQAASNRDRVATSADFVANAWQNGRLKASIANQLSTIEDVRPLAQELVNFLNAAFKPDPSPGKNRRMFANQSVSGTAAIGMVTMGWIK